MKTRKTNREKKEHKKKRENATVLPGECNGSRIRSVIFMISISVFLGGCHTNENERTSSTSSDIYQSEEQTNAVIEFTPDVTEGVVIEEQEAAAGEEKETSIIDSSEDTQSERVADEINKDIDGNGSMDTVQSIRWNDDSDSLIRVFINGERIFEYKDPNHRIMGLDAFEYLDLDGDDIKEIFITAETDANSRPLHNILCLKQIDGQWKRMNIPLNETGNNGFSFKIIRGKDEFDFVISSDDIEEEIHFDASDFFVEEESDNIDTIQSYRKNNYKEGDEVGFISAHGIWEAKAGTYEGRNCIIALQGIEGPYGHGLGEINIYFSFNEQGGVEILKVKYNSIK